MIQPDPEITSSDSDTESNDETCKKAKPKKTRMELLREMTQRQKPISQLCKPKEAKKRARMEKPEKKVKKPKEKKEKMEKPKTKKEKELEIQETEKVSKQEMKIAFKRAKPKAPKSSWIIFITTERKRLHLPLTEVSKICGIKWKNMTEEEKEPYKQLSREDVLRYHQEKDNLSTKEEQIIRQQKKLKRKLRITSEKRPKSSFILFMDRNRPSITQENPGLPIPEIAKIGGKMWQELSLEEKAIYQNLAKKNKEEYDERIMNSEKEAKDKPKKRRKREKQTRREQSEAVLEQTETNEYQGEEEVTEVQEEETNEVQEEEVTEVQEEETNEVQEEEVTEVQEEEVTEVQEEELTEVQEEELTEVQEEEITEVQEEEITEVQEEEVQEEEVTEVQEEEVTEVQEEEVTKVQEEEVTEVQEEEVTEVQEEEVTEVQEEEVQEEELTEVQEE
jgi:hypothetical protein